VGVGLEFFTHLGDGAEKVGAGAVILLMKAMRGTPYLLAGRQTVSDWGWTPATAQKTATAPSRTRMERSTSAVKSTCPGVSMMLVWVRMPFHGPQEASQAQEMAAAVMVMPRSRSCSIQSVTAVPSWTSPILWTEPE
jgi:hypothetical protein